MKKPAIACIAFLALTICASAQDGPCEIFNYDLDTLAENAAETVTVTMDARTLQFAGNFLNKKNPEESQAQKLISNLRGLCVRSYEYEKDGQYEQYPLENMRSNFQYNDDWSHMVAVHSKRDKENVDIFLRMEKGAVAGVVIIASAPKEVTIVHIDGAINLAQLAELGGQLGIPKLDIPLKSKPSMKSESK
jgi:hypothetical protein